MKILRYRAMLTALTLGLVLASTSVAAGASAAPQRSHAANAVVTMQAASPVPGPLFLLSASQAKALRSNQTPYASVISKCNSELSTVAQPVGTLDIQPHYTGGGENPNSVNPLAPDAQMAYRAGLCYLVTGETQYATHAQQIIDAWANTLKNVSNSQSQNAINFDMPYMIGAATWIRNVGGWDVTPFNSLLTDVVLPNAELSNNTNHGLWAVFMEASIAELRNDQTLLGAAKTRWSQILKAEVTQPDGSMPKEAERSDTSCYACGPDKGIKGIDYTHFALLPASMAATIFAQMGHPIWTTSDGSRLRKAFSIAAAWTLDPSTDYYWSGDPSKLIGVTTCPYFPMLLRHFGNANAAQVVANGNITADGFMLMKLFA